MSKKKPNRPNNIMKHELLRNPLFKEKREKSAEEKAEQRNPFSKKAKHKGKLEEGEWVAGMEMTPENYVIEWVKHGRKNTVPLESWEQYFQDAGMIEQAEHQGYIHIARNVACDVSLTDKGKQLVVSHYEAGKRPQSLEEFYQVGDKVKVENGALKKVLDRAEKLRKKNDSEKGKEPDKKSEPISDEGIVREPMGPANTLWITINGEYHIVDEDDVKLIYEAFDYVELNEWTYAETTSGIRVPISSEEGEIFNMCSNPVYKSNMDDREQEVARRMVSRGVLHRNKDEDGIFFYRDSKKLTRF